MLIKDAPDILKWIKTEWIKELNWDASNLSKLNKHGFTHDEVNKVFNSEFFFEGEVLGEFNERRFISYGKLEDGRYMTIAWTTRKNKIRPISCRRARDEEKAKYNSAK